MSSQQTTTTRFCTVPTCVAKLFSPCLSTPLDQSALSPSSQAPRKEEQRRASVLRFPTVPLESHGTVTRISTPPVPVPRSQPNKTAFKSSQAVPTQSHEPYPSESRPDITRPRKSSAISEASMRLPPRPTLKQVSIDLESLRSVRRTFVNQESNVTRSPSLGNARYGDEMRSPQHTPRTTKSGVTSGDSEAGIRSSILRLPSFDAVTLDSQRAAQESTRTTSRQPTLTRRSSRSPSMHRSSAAEARNAIEDVPTLKTTPTAAARSAVQHSTVADMRTANVATPQTLKRSRLRASRPNEDPNASALKSPKVFDFSETRCYLAVAEELNADTDGRPKTPTAATKALSALKRMGDTLVLRGLPATMIPVGRQFARKAVTIYMDSSLEQIWWDAGKRFSFKLRNLYVALDWVGILRTSRLYPHLASPSITGLSDTDRRNLMVLEFADHNQYLQRQWLLVDSGYNTAEVAKLLQTIRHYQRQQDSSREVDSP